MAECTHRYDIGSSVLCQLHAAGMDSTHRTAISTPSTGATAGLSQASTFGISPSYATTVAGHLHAVQTPSPHPKSTAPTDVSGPSAPSMRASLGVMPNTFGVLTPVASTSDEALPSLIEEIEENHQSHSANESPNLSPSNASPEALPGTPMDLDTDCDQSKCFIRCIQNHS